jgi:arabinogalactan oligomer/maltooligosaccharide transport system permease protein
MTKERPKFSATNAAIYIILTVLSVIWLFPVAWLIMSSFRAEPGAFTAYVIPKGFTLSNYSRLFTDVSLFNYPRWYLNTFIVACLSCAISTFYVLSISYVLSRLRFTGRTAIMNVLLVLGMFPGFMSMIAVYNIIKSFGLAQSLAALVVVYSSGAALTYYITKGFFDTIPRSLDEAALIDGATKSQVFFKIILPISGPIVTYTALTTFIAPWLDFVFASIIMKDNYANYTIAVGLYRMIERENLNAYFTRFCAGAVLIAIPITILFIKMQGMYVEGVTGGAVKG